MSKIMDDLREEAMAKGEEKKARDMAKSLYTMGMAIEKIAQIAGYPIDVVKSWVGAPA